MSANNLVIVPWNDATAVAALADDGTLIASNLIGDYQDPWSYPFASPAAMIFRITQGFAAAKACGIVEMNIPPQCLSARVLRCGGTTYTTNLAAWTFGALDSNTNYTAGDYTALQQDPYTSTFATKCSATGAASLSFPMSTSEIVDRGPNDERSVLLVFLLQGPSGAQPTGDTSITVTVDGQARAVGTPLRNGLYGAWFDLSEADIVGIETTPGTSADVIFEQEAGGSDALEIGGFAMYNVGGLATEYDSGWIPLATSEVDTMDLEKINAGFVRTLFAHAFLDSGGTVQSFNKGASSGPQTTICFDLLRQPSDPFPTLVTETPAVNGNEVKLLQGQSVLDAAAPTAQLAIIGDALVTERAQRGTKRHFESESLTRVSVGGFPWSVVRRQRDRVEFTCKHMNESDGRLFAEVIQRLSTTSPALFIFTPDSASRSSVYSIYGMVDRGSITNDGARETVSFSVRQI